MQGHWLNLSFFLPITRKIASELSVQPFTYSSGLMVAMEVTLKTAIVKGGTVVPTDKDG